ncbi:hypothetical protein [Emticicia sp. 17c]|uniref:hypothetical protein n=1 Tax=Emticicia sp. 17c TaxID=3127704 RepID=UPI00301DCB4D
MKIINNIVLLSSFALIGLAGCSGEIVTTPPPTAVVETIPAPITPRHVWVPGHYVARGGTYVWRNGYYTVPPRGRRVWVEGHYQRTPKGYVYRRGHWRR